MGGWVGVGRRMNGWMDELSRADPPAGSPPQPLPLPGTDAARSVSSPAHKVAHQWD